MDGWLAYHAAFVACIAAALYRCGTDPVRLAADRPTLALMSRAITEAFAALRASGTGGRPRNLAVLHSPLIRAVAVRYWARTMRSPMGELCFAAHSRHAQAEMRALGNDVAARIPGSPAVAELLGPRHPAVRLWCARLRYPLPSRRIAARRVLLWRVVAGALDRATRGV